MPVNFDTPLPTEKAVIVSSESDEVRYTCAMLDFLEASGLLEGRNELVNGRIYSRMGQNLRHSQTVSRLMRYLETIELFQGERVVFDTNLTIADSEQRPAPDVLVMKEPLMEGRPAGSDLYLAIEVSDTTHTRDFAEKPPTYSHAGIAEYWILDLSGRTLTVFRDPNAELGTWETRITLAETKTVAPESAPDAVVKVADLLPPIMPKVF